MKAAAKSSSKEAGKLLDWAEEQLDEILDYSAFVEDADRAEQMSGELSRSSRSWRLENLCKFGTTARTTELKLGVAW